MISQHVCCTAMPGAFNFHSSSLSGQSSHSGWEVRLNWRLASQSAGSRQQRSRPIFIKVVISMTLGRLWSQFDLLRLDKDESVSLYQYMWMGSITIAQVEASER